MKKSLLLAIVSISLLLLTSCGNLEEKKNQMKALGEGVDLIKDVGKIGEGKGTDQEKQNQAIDRLAQGLGNMMNGSDQELTAEEKLALQEGADMLKDGGQGVKDQVNALLLQMEKEEAERKAKEKAQALEDYGTEEQPDWAVEKGIIKPEGLTFEYRFSTGGPNDERKMDYKVFYSEGSKTPIEVARQLLEGLGFEVNEFKENGNVIEVSGYGDDENITYNIQANKKELSIRVFNKNWFKELEQ